MKRIVAVTIGLAFLTVLTGSAFAQPANEDDPIIQEQKRKKKDAEEIDKRYKSTLDQTSKDGPSGRIDPWANMRNADGSKTKR